MGGAHGSNLAYLAAGSGSTVSSLPGEKSGLITAQGKVRKVSRDTLAGERSNTDAELGTTSNSMLRGSAIGTAPGAEPREVYTRERRLLTRSSHTADRPVGSAAPG